MRQATYASVTVAVTLIVAKLVVWGDSRGEAIDQLADIVGRHQPDILVGGLRQSYSEDLDLEDILLLQDGHCFRDGVVNLCKGGFRLDSDRFQLESGSFETLVKLADEGLGMTLLPYLHTLDLGNGNRDNLRFFQEPPPAREVSLIYHKKELKFQITESLKEVIASVVRGAIAFQDVKIISPTLQGNRKQPR